MNCKIMPPQQALCTTQSYKICRFYAQITLYNIHETFLQRNLPLSQKSNIFLQMFNNFYTYIYIYIYVVIYFWGL